MSRPQKSTIVRFQNRARRALFRSADLLAPNLAGRIARDIRFTVPPRTETLIVSTKLVGPLMFTTLAVLPMSLKMSTSSKAE